ncbi:BTAD domain-containing putative transcriptional regulator [Amycolatopsis aidingensis]|uniref:BTAD domain-containing putative transcriptional regulator n=1 Tax=Amycolatopsis aidingensis TaxID=2842453 RepID=UPI001C0CD932|nr:BTAD domain-containing putative transcriptional regulator [Amycolatopsis aidingensis]
MLFGILGPLALWTPAGEAARLPELKARALLADLLLHEGRPVPADRLVADLWGEHPPGNPTATLQNKVWQLRKALDAAAPGGRDLVVSGASGYLLRVEAEAVDAGRFAALVRAARPGTSPAERAGRLAEALALWRGPALADFADEHWAQAAIARLDEQRLSGLEELAEARLELGEPAAELAGELGELVANNPLRERLRATYLRALYRAGRQGEALASYADLRARLAEELGTDPGPELVTLHQAILRQDAELDAPARAGNLPAPLTRLVGRADALAEVCAQLGEQRLVTLTGVGGVGKTRLALAAAAAVPEESWLVELAELTASADPGELGPAAGAVMAALGIRDDGGPVLDRLAEALRPRRLLLVLDNCEHVIAPVAELAARLLRVAPGLRILATSRDPLGLAGERLHPVAPLELPGPAVAPSAAEVADSSAVALFADRARAAAPGFSLTAEIVPDVLTLCRKLDGIPLALELAAARVRALGVSGLLARLDDRFRLLSGGHRGAPPRQQTLRATIDWSWDLLSEPERAVLRRLAMHQGGCTLAAAEQVCAGDGIAAGDVLDVVVRLVDRSMLVAAEQPGGVRYRLLESVREYCLERLADAREAGWARQRHAGYYAELAERAEPELYGRDQRRWLELLDGETANLRAALETLAAEGTGERAARMVCTLCWYWYLRGKLSEARRALDLVSAGAAASGSFPAEVTCWRAIIGLFGGDFGEHGRTAAALERLPEITDPSRRARARWLLGFARSTTGDGEWDACAELAEGALSAFRELDEPWGAAAARTARAVLAMARSDLSTLRQDGEQALAMFRELGERWGQSQAMSLLAVLAEITGDHARAAGLHTEGLRLAEELGLWTEAADRLAGLGRIELLRGEHARAWELHERGMRLAAEQGSKSVELYAQIGLGLGARREGKLDLAEEHLNAVLDWNVRARSAERNAVPLALVLAELGFVAEQRADAPEARRRHLRGLGLARRTGDPRALALAMEGLAGAQALAGQHEHAASLLGAAAAARESAGAPLPEAERGDVDRIAAQARAALGNPGFAAEFERGRTTDPDQLLTPFDTP